MTADDVLLRPSRRRRWSALRWGALAVAALAIGIGAVFGARLGTDPTLVDSPLIGQPVPDRQLPFLEGAGSLSLADLRGQIVVVNFWASWCVPCREEHPALVSTARAYRDSGVSFVGVSYQDGRDSAVEFLDELGRGEGYRYVIDPGSRLAIDFGVFGVPETYFIDRRGAVVAKITGASDDAVLSGVLDSLLAGRRPESRVVGSVQPTPTDPGGS